MLLDSEVDEAIAALQAYREKKKRKERAARLKRKEETATWYYKAKNEKTKG